MTRYAVGIGARPGVAAGAVRALVARVLAAHGIDPADAVFATVDARAAEPGLLDALRAVAPGSGAPTAWAPAELAAEPVPHPDGRVAAAVGTPSVAEAAALRTARALPGATGAALLVGKTAGRGVTIAIAVPHPAPSGRDPRV